MSDMATIGQIVVFIVAFFGWAAVAGMGFALGASFFPRKYTVTINHVAASVPA